MRSYRRRLPRNRSCLLKNESGLLPLRGVKSIAVIGGNADKGVIAGGGSSDVTPVGGAIMIKDHTFLPSPPLDALKHELPRSQIAFDPGTDLAAAAALAAKSDVAVVFVTQHDSEGYDGSLVLADNQDALVAAVAKANPRTIVVVESGGAIFMPWLDQVPAVLEAFFPGHPRRPGDRPNSHRQGRPVGPPSDQLPGLDRPACPSGFARPGHAQRNPGAYYLR